MGTIVNIEFKEVDDETIERDKLFNVYVLGLPRSGTSMTMGVLEMLGVNMVHTSEEDKEKTDERFKNKYGEYHANPLGFREITHNQFTNYLKMLGNYHSGCKMIVPVTGIRWEILTQFPSKVIFITRDVEEIRQSQEAYYAKEGSVDIAYLKSALVTQRINLKKAKIPTIEINYNHFLIDKVKVIQTIKEFIRSDRDIQEAVDFVQPKNNRFKRENLINGL
jgi:hypothetical protein